ncbi:hypothetical protein QBC41DRAFT_332202 [Cercophora samala]|uniref:Uncharacterized protein n=1 Tax=Cercophora samala TaxID=330535 RepID=A0AA39YL30_9PEZI|nr:hypothetical protein QBC41DRAFT_332202 [Cercophora samala]
MFRWYREAQVCYVYLSDVSHDDDHRLKWSRFRLARWFTRGWTLQELIAPSVVYFFASDWQEIGSRHGLLNPIVHITGIHVEYFRSGDLSVFSVAQKMSWAAKRKTTRVEDMAYCLLGIFDINMPLLYGEGKRAFARLQEEILKDTEDDSIFYHASISTSILATQPSDFANSGNIVTKSWPYSTQNPSSIVARDVSINRKRVEMTFMTWQGPRHDPGTLSILLDCSVHDTTPNTGPGPSLELVLKEVAQGVFACFSGTHNNFRFFEPTATTQAMQDATPRKITVLRQDIPCSSAWEEIQLGKLRWDGFPVSGRLWHTTATSASRECHGVAVVWRTGMSADVDGYHQPLNKEGSSTVTIQGPSEASTSFQIAEVCSLDGFLNKCVQDRDKIHLAPLFSKRWGPASLWYCNKQGKSFMLVVVPRVTRIETRLYTNIPLCEVRNPFEFTVEVEGRHPVKNCARGDCPRYTCVSCPRQMVDDHTEVLIRISTRKRAEGWWVFISTEPTD